MLQCNKWDGTMPEDWSIDFLTGLASIHFARGGRVGSKLLDILRLQDFVALCDYEVDYAGLSLDHDVSQIIAIRQGLALFTKLDFLGSEEDKRSRAWSTFIEAEASCRKTNEAFRLWTLGEFSFLPGVDSILFRAQRKISSVLGPVPSWEQLKPRFGPGANSGIKKSQASAKMKLSAPLSCSSNFAPYASSMLSEMPHLCSLHSTEEDELRYVVPLSVETGRIAFVPKSPKTFRTIGVEPLLNSMGQLAIGDYIAKRLLRVGIDIRDQSKNKNLARLGSITGDLATLDLSSASDTISYELVWHLLPPDWALFLSSLRTSKYEVPSGEVLHLEKFSSMGNGFTFPLETLIFWALCSSVSSSPVSTYGDDIIIATADFDAAVDILTFAGFQPNKSKSFSEGPFRESCGGDYFLGIDIRPVYQKTLVHGFDLFRLHNAFVRLSDFESAHYVLDFISEDIRLWGPDGFGDGHLLGVPARPFNRQHGWGGFIFDTFTFKKRRDQKPRPGDRILPYYSIYLREDGNDNEDPDSLYQGKIYRDSSLANYPKWLNAILGRESSPTPHVNAVPTNTLPGVRGYKRISIYTLTPT